MQEHAQRIGDVVQELEYFTGQRKPKRTLVDLRVLLGESLHAHGLAEVEPIVSGETLVLGGLIKNIDQAAQGGLPGLSRIPVIGGLFGRRTRSNNREELLVLITPHVIRNPDEARRLTDDYTRQFKGIEPLRVRVEN